jgi:hypothetical protein
MGISGGPNILGDENLAFIYDLADANSYIGEPTRNYSSGDESFVANIDTSVSNATTDLPNGGTGVVRRVTITNGSSGISRAYLGYSPTFIPQANISYTISHWIRSISSVQVAAGWEVEVGASDGYARPDNESGYIGNYASTTQPNLVTSQWQKVSYTFSYNSTKTSNLYPLIYFGNPTGGSGGGLNGTVDIYQTQLEINNHATPYIGPQLSRSVTGSLFDLSPNRTEINVTNMSFDSTAQLLFNGTSSVMNPIAAWSYLSSSALECVFKTNTISGFKTIFGYFHNGGYSAPTIGSIYLNGSALGASVITTTQVYRGVQASTTIATNQFYHVVLNKNVSVGTLDIYVNGVLNGTQTFDSASYAQWPTLGNYIGSNVLDIGKSSNTSVDQGWSVSALTGSIPLARLYSRVLSASEVLQNYNAVKSRFNL